MNKREKQVYEKTIEMFNGCCAICGSPDIQLHHIRYGDGSVVVYIVMIALRLALKRNEHHCTKYIFSHNFNYNLHLQSGQTFEIFGL